MLTSAVLAQLQQPAPDHDIAVPSAAFDPVALFLQHFDGMSIGSNDLSREVDALGLDRDNRGSNMGDFDEHDQRSEPLISAPSPPAAPPAEYVGICGQGRSDHADFADWLAAEGIVSISLSPDTVVDAAAAPRSGANDRARPPEHYTGGLSHTAPWNDAVGRLPFNRNPTRGVRASLRSFS